MTIRRAIMMVTAFAALLFASSIAAAQVITRVVDGDTIVVQSVGTVRLIGVDTPETVDPRQPVRALGKEASDFTRRLAEGKVARLEYDVERKDKYNRTLAYVYLPDGVLLNAEIVKQGYGHAYTEFPFKYLEQFRTDEREARDARRGLWADEGPAQGLPVTQAAQVNADLRVWVNTASRVYHCPGTRYYGKTKSGTYMSERDAKEHAYRPAYGNECQPSESAETLTQTAPSSATDIHVWVNTASRVYHCPGTRYYGSTKAGSYMTQTDAKQRGYRPAYGAECH
jgi:endonuclease YncB( thermonuclease family)